MPLLAKRLQDANPQCGWRRSLLPCSIAAACGAILAATLWAGGAHRVSLTAKAQEVAAAPTEEIVANLAAGRVVIAVVKDAILVATVENPIEAETRPPVPVQLASSRIGVVLGSVEWWSPSEKQELARLDRELPHLRTLAVTRTPHLGQSQGGEEAADIEEVGQGLFERLRVVAQSLHGKVDLPANEPIVELIVADYLAGYGPEVWQMSYRIKQQQEHGEYWTTRVLPPVYLQFWPPEKGQPRTLVEFEYPPRSGPPGTESPEDGSQKNVPTLLELLHENDPRLDKIRKSDARMANVADRLLAGESNKVTAADGTQFLRAALDAIAPPGAGETMATLGSESGFAWVLPLPPEPLSPRVQSDRPADAPSLARPPQ